MADNDGNSPLPAAIQQMLWAGQLLADADSRRIGLHTIDCNRCGPTEVSTVFLVIGHPGPRPALPSEESSGRDAFWETAASDTHSSRIVGRYTTADAAQSGHQTVVAQTRLLHPDHPHPQPDLSQVDIHNHT